MKMRMRERARARAREIKDHGVASFDRLDSWRRSFENRQGTLAGTLECSRGSRGSPGLKSEVREKKRRKGKKTKESVPMTTSNSEREDRNAILA